MRAKSVIKGIENDLDIETATKIAELLGEDIKDHEHLFVYLWKHNFNEDNE
jgi:hypothetical protein